jgi:alkylated DNA repair dioxygenase AlkB
MAEQENNKEYGKSVSYYQPRPVKMPELPDFTSEAAKKRSDPFRLADFRGSNAYQKPT